MDTADEAKRVFKISLGKLEYMKSQRVSKSLHKNLLVNSVFNRVISIVSDVDSLTEDIVSNPNSALTNAPPLVLEPVPDSGRANEPSDGIEYVNLERAEVSLEDVKAPPSFIQANSNSEGNCSGVEPKPEYLTLSNGHRPYHTVPVEQEYEPSEEYATISRGVKRGADFDCDKDYNFKRCRYVEHDDDNNCSENGSEIFSWRSPADFSDLDDESDLEVDMDSEPEMHSPVIRGHVYCDENTKVNTPTDVKQILSLVTVFSSSFRGLGDFYSCTEEGMFKSYNSRSCDHMEWAPIRRSTSLPNLSTRQADLNLQPKPKKKKTGPVVLRI